MPPVCEDDGTLVPYEYQLSMLEAAKEKNIIVALHTGGGKTFVAIMLMRHLAHEVRASSFLEGGKRTVFLVCTVPLVEQQAAFIVQQTDLIVGKYCGGMGVDFWDKKKWTEEFDKHEVLVMTAAIFDQLLSQGFLRFNQLNLLIFDECHHADKDHPYASIMKKYDDSDQNNPKILGLTASLVNKKIGIKKLQQEVARLESTLRCVAETGSYLSSSSRIADKYIYYNNVPCPLETFLLKKLKELFEKLDVFLKEKRRVGNRIASAIVDDICQNPHALKSVPLKYAMMLNDIEVPVTMGDIKKLCNALISVLEQLGIACFLIAIEFVQADIQKNRYKSLMNDDDRLMFTEFQTVIRKLQQHALNHGEKFEGFEYHVDDHRSSLFSDKLTCLINAIYNETNSNEDFSNCIIFVKMQLIGLVIKEFFLRLSRNPKYAFLRPGFVSGHQSVLIPMNWKMQGKIIEQFRASLINILVATPVIEEGLDIPSCNYVFHFDPPTTTVSYIQAKGRARSKNSSYVIMIPESEKERCERTIRTFKELEEMITKPMNWVEKATNDSDDGQKVVSPENHELIKIGNCMLSPSETVAFVYKYCAKLSNGDCSCSAPYLLVKRVQEGKFKCVLIMPRNSALQATVIGKECASKKMAKADACAAACKLLHEMGEIDDDMIPKSWFASAVPCEVADTDSDAETGAVYSKSNHFTAEVPYPFCQIFDGVLYLYAMRCENASPMFQNHKYGFVTFGPLPPCIPPLKLSSQSYDFKVCVEYCGALSATHSDFELLKIFNKALYAARLKKSITADDENNEINVLPCILRRIGTLVGIDWEAINNACSDARNDNIAHQEKTKGCVVKKNYGDRRSYVVIDVDESVNAMSAFPNSDFTFNDYFVNKYRCHIRNPDAPLLRVRVLPKIQDFIEKTTLREKKSSNRGFIYLIPELVTSTGMTSDLINFSDVLFSTVFRLCCCIHAHDVIKTISDNINLQMTNVPKNSTEASFDSMKNNSGNNVGFSTLDLDQMNLFAHPDRRPVPTSPCFYAEIMKALTLKSSLEIENLERLELLGDSFLKIVLSMHCYMTYNFFDEGRLSRIRSAVVSNKNLFKVAVRLELYRHIIRKPFWPCETIAPGFFSAENIRYFDDFEIGSKHLSDVVESLIGACLVCRGCSQTVEMMNNMLGMNVDCSGKSVSRDIPENSADLINTLWLKHGLDSLERKLGYTFKDKSLLLEAVSHPTAFENTVTPCYQRLEFLGDALIDFLITRHLFMNCKDSDPGKITDMRSALVNNCTFAIIGALNNINQHLLHYSPAVFSNIKAFMTFMESYDKENLDWYELCWAATPPPKILADVVESIAGAIFVDSNYCFRTVWNVYERLLHDIIELFMNNVPVNPIRFVHENAKHCVFQKQKRENETTDESAVACIVNYVHTFYGVGENYVIAKRRAALKAKAFLLSQRPS